MTLSWGDLAPTAEWPHSAAPLVGDPGRRLAALALAIARRPALWRPLVRHDPDLRWHARLASCDDVEIWLLGWTTAQEVEMHDHGGSFGAFAVAEGALSETYTEAGERTPLRTVSCPAGSTRSFGPGRIHHVSNAGSTPATSVHVYSPPLSTMRFYDTIPGRTPAATRVEHILPDGGPEQHGQAFAPPALDLVRREDPR